MEEWKYEDFEKWINGVKTHSEDPNNIWDSITCEITVRKDFISADNLDCLFYDTFRSGLLSSSDLSKFFMITHMYGHPWRLFKNDYRKLFEYLQTPVIDSFAESLYCRLPDSFAVFRVLRGIKENEVNWVNLGFCWSLNKDIALKIFGGEHGVLLSGKCKKKSIVACFDFRFENEVIVDPSNVSDLAISSY